MSKFDVESRLPSLDREVYDASGNIYSPNYLDEVEIVNVPETMRFIRTEKLTENDYSSLLNILQDVQPHEKTDSDNLNEGTYFASYADQGSETLDIPAQVFIGTITNQEGNLVVLGNVLISYHAIGDKLKPKIIGFEIDDKSTIKPVKCFGKIVMGASLSPERYQAIVSTLEAIPRESTLPHPSTKEFARQEPKFRELVEKFKSFGLKEITGAMFKSEGENKKAEKMPETTLTAVHPYYLEYHDSFGQREKLTPKARQDLLRKYDDLFRDHCGPLVIVEEESRILSTLSRLKKDGRKGDIYFVITENTASSNFPYTNNTEFMQLLNELNVEGLKFVGGHDAGDKPYHGSQGPYSGCLRGLANRIEKRGFPKVQTIPGYTYS